MLKKTRGAFDLKPQLLSHGPGNESPEHVTCHNPADTSVGFLQCCETPNSKSFQNLLQDASGGEELSDLEQQSHVTVILKNWT